MFINKKFDIRSKFIISYIFVLLVSILLFSGIVYINSSTAVRKQMCHFTEQLLDLARGNMQTQMSAIENTLDSIQANRKIIDLLSMDNEEYFFNNLPFLKEELLNVDKFHTKISSVNLYTLNDKKIPEKYENNVVFNKKSSMNEPWFKDTLSVGGAPVWTVFYNSLGYGTAAASKVIYEPRKASEPIAVVRVDIDLLPFLNKINDIKLGKTGKIFLVQENSIISIDKNSFVNNLVNEYEFFNAVRDNKEKSSYVVINGVKYLISYDNLIGTNLLIAAMVPAVELDGTIHSVGYSIIVTAILCIAIGLVLSSFFAKIITKPTIELSTIMKNFDNDFNIRVKPKTNDEIGQLYTSFNLMLEKIQTLIKENYELNRKKNAAELKALQAQINPHFLYNTLESINWMAIKAGENKIGNMVSALGSFFRYSLNNGKEFITVENEIEQVKSYIEIQKVRFMDKFDVKINVEPDILNHKILKLIIQPIVENCIVHAFEDIDYMGEIDIYACEHEKGICIKISDNGIGTDVEFLNEYIDLEDEVIPSKGKYGIKNVQKRLKLYFGDECGITYTDNSPNGLAATVLIGYEK